MTQPAPVTEFPDLRRVGVIDVGSNSVRLVIFDGAARSPAYFFNEKVMCGLGRGIGETGRLNGEGRARAILAMDRFKSLIDSFEVQSLHTVATAAVRDATDGSAFVSEVADRTGIALTVASGQEEARLSAQGVLLGWPEAEGLVCDIGGASMELAEVSGGQVGRTMTSPLGPLQLADTPGGEAGIDRRIREHVSAMRRHFDGDYKTLYLVGGSYRAIAKVDMVRRSYPLGVLHEYAMDREHLHDLLGWLKDTSPDTLQDLGVAGDRAPLIPLVSRVLAEVVASFDPDVAAVSSYGIREGMLYEQMPPELRHRDPLIEACASMERVSARLPGFGAQLGDWVRPVLPAGAKWDRMARAAGLLHDVSWRSHPSSRAEECFDNASRGNLGGLDHAGRVLLAVALLHRYSKSPKTQKYHALIPLLSDEEQRAAQVLGYGLRLGASLAGGDAGVLAGTRLLLSDDRLEVRLPQRYAAHAGEAVARRVDMLASALGVPGVLTVA